MDEEILQLIKTKAAQIFPEIVAIRRHLHANPELSFNEVETARYIANVLTQAGITYTSGWAGHGIVAIIPGKTDHVIALRADMDALPIIEDNDVSYKSINHGLMHACGHDVHSACLLGAAMILHSLKGHLSHSYRLIFQPGEEKLPGGASIMIEEGVLLNPVPQSIIGQHVFPSLEVGKVGIRSGLYMASADEIYITVRGKGGHGAMPQECNDTVLAACQVIVSLQQLVSRMAHPNIPSVLSFGKFNTSGGATNIIPDEVKIEGTFRTLDEDWRAKAHDLIRNIVEGTAQAHGVNVELQILKGYPCLVNDRSLSGLLKSQMEQYLGADNVVDLDMRMTSEDFAFYSQKIPACFYRLGTGNKQKGIVSPVHTSTFDIDERALEIGAGMMAWLAVNQ